MRTYHSFRALLAIALASILHSPAAAQERGTPSDVLLAASKHLRAENAGNLRVEGRTPGVSEALLSRRADAAADRIEIVPPGQTFRCADRAPATCRLHGADLLLSFAEPEVRGARASVVVDVRAHGHSARQPVAWKRIRLQLERGAGGWSVTSEELMEIS